MFRFGIKKFVRELPIKKYDIGENIFRLYGVSMGFTCNYYLFNEITKTNNK
jgi:hypothetical protein